MTILCVLLLCLFGCDHSQTDIIPPKAGPGQGGSHNWQGPDGNEHHGDRGDPTQQLPTSYEMLEIEVATSTLPMGHTENAHAFAIFANSSAMDVTKDKDLFWESSNEYCATISESGEIIAKHIGDVYITVSDKSGDYQDITHITITDAELIGLKAELIGLDDSTQNDILVGEHVNIRITGTFSDNTQLDITAQTTLSIQDNTTFISLQEHTVQGLSIGTAIVNVSSPTCKIANDCNTTLDVDVVAGSNIVTWGNSLQGANSVDVQSELTNVKTIFSTKQAFAALTYQDKVISWGYENQRKDSPVIEVPSDLTNIKTIFSTYNTFAALTNEGGVITWGEECQNNSLCTDVPSKLSNIDTIYTNESAFAAVDDEGGVVTWGDTASGGDYNKKTLTNIKAIYSTDRAFAALTDTGQVITWGDTLNGGNYDGNSNSKFDVIYSTKTAFAGIKDDGSVYAWGNNKNGANEPTDDLVDVDVDIIYSTYSAFAALTKKGKVIPWGYSSEISNDENITDQPLKVTKISTSMHAFAALTENGSVITWGQKDCGGDSSGVEEQLTQNVVDIFATDSAFAALKANGSVVSWGYDSPKTGSSVIEVPPNLVNIKTIFSTGNAFAALTNTGHVITWGDEGMGGNSYDVQSKLVNIKTIFSTEGAFAAARN